MDNLGELIEKLCILNIKLFEICDKKAEVASNPSKFSKEEIVELIKKDIVLCEGRAATKNAINKVAGVKVAEEVKSYG